MLATLPVLVLVSALVVLRMTRRGVLDIPGARSSHDRPTPKGGGVGIAVATLLGIAGAGAAGWCVEARPLAGALVAGALIAVVAHADDRLQFGSGWKLGAQLLAALILVATGSMLTRIGPLQLGPLAPVVTVAIVLLFTNALNFIDGLNGLAAGCGLLAAVVVGARAIALDDRLPAAVALPLAAGLLGFLPFNYPRARIFMGDVGSQFVGLLLAFLTVDGTTLLPGHAGVFLTPLMVLPVLGDVAFTLGRRLFNRDRLVEAHRSHLYQLAHRAGVPAPTITLVYWGLSAIGAAGAWSPPAWPSAFAVSLLGLGVWGATALLSARRAPIGRW